MKTLFFVVAMFLSANSAFAGGCDLLIQSYDVGPGAKYSQDDISKLYSKGYVVTHDSSAILEGVLTLISGSSCTTYLGFWEVCEVSIQVGTPSYGGVSLSYPVTGSSVSDAIGKLPACY